MRRALVPRSQVVAPLHAYSPDIACREPAAPSELQRHAGSAAIVIEQDGEYVAHYHRSVRDALVAARQGLCGRTDVTWHLAVTYPLGGDFEAEEHYLSFEREGIEAQLGQNYAGACTVGLVLGPGGACDNGSHRFQVLSDGWRYACLVPSVCGRGLAESTAILFFARDGFGVSKGATGSGQPAIFLAPRLGQDSRALVACRTTQTDWLIETFPGAARQSRAGVCTGGSVTRWIGGSRAEDAVPLMARGASALTTHAGACTVDLVLGPGGACDIGSERFRILSDGRGRYGSISSGQGIATDGFGASRIPSSDAWRIAVVP